MRHPGFEPWREHSTVSTFGGFGSLVLGIFLIKKMIFFLQTLMPVLILTLVSRQLFNTLNNELKPTEHIREGVRSEIWINVPSHNQMHYTREHMCNILSIQSLHNCAFF